jgi:glyoxalase superfamily protein
MADDEGGTMALGIQVVIDCADPTRLAKFWTFALGYVEEPPPEGFSSWEEFLVARKIPESAWNDAGSAVDPDGKGPRIFFQRVPEKKVVKNRVHLDVNAGGPRGTPPAERRPRVDAAVERLTAAGATVLRVADENEYWVVMQDPEGNEFCVQ